MSELLDLHIDLFRQLQADPYKVIDAGLIKIISAVRLDEQGNLVQLDAAPVNRFTSDETGSYTPPMEYIRTLALNRPQKMLRAAHRLYQRKGIPFRADLLKARSVGATTYAQALFAATVATRSGVACLDVAHKPKSTNNIYQIGSNMVKRMPDWVRPMLENDSRELLKTVNPEWGISESSITNVSCTNIDALRSFRFLMALLDEAAWYENGEEVQAATNSIMMNTPESFLLKATTGNGEDPFFYPEFMSAWEAQGNKNFWEGGRLFRYPSFAIFFPFYFDTSKYIDPDTAEDYSQGLLYLDLNEMEYNLLIDRMIPMWKEFGYSEEEAKRHGLCQLYWRRCKVSTENLSMPRPSSVPGGTFTSFKKFVQEEPATVEEAFQSTVGDRVFSDDLRRKVQGAVCAPKRKGRVEDGKFIDDPYGALWLWKEPSEMTDLIFSIDPNPGIMDQNIETTKADYTWGFVFERSTGEQVGEYTSRAPLYHCLKEIHEIALFLRGSSIDIEKHPMVVPEVQQGGAQLINFFLENGYPPMRIYRRPEKEDKAGKNVSTSYGFHTNVQSKPTAINLMVSYLYEDKLTLRSARILDQMLYFVETKARTYQAQMKGRGGAASKDDGIMAAAIAVYADTYTPEPLPPSFDFEPAGLAAKLKAPPLGTQFLVENQKFYEQCEELGIDPDTIPRPGWTPVVKKKTTWKPL